MAKYYIYKVTEIKTQKSYIGLTKNPERRIKDYLVYKGNHKTEFTNKFRKYGLDKFTFEIIYVLLDVSVQFAEVTEMLLIKEFTSHYGKEKTFNKRFVLHNGGNLNGSGNKKDFFVYRMKDKTLFHHKSLNEANLFHGLSKETARKSMNSSGGFSTRKGLSFGYSAEECINNFKNATLWIVKDIKKNKIFYFKNSSEASIHMNMSRNNQAANYINKIYKNYMVSKGVFID